MGKEKDDKNKIEIVSAGAEPGTGGGPVKREESREQQRNEQYNQYVEQVTPKANCLLNCVKAFITGGCICTVGQILTVLFLNSGMGKDEAAAYTTISLVFASVVLTGLNIYPLITTWGGKSPCIVHKSADIKLAAKRIVFGKFLNCGQTCVAPDYIYCDSTVKDELVNELKKQIQNTPFHNVMRFDQILVTSILTSLLPAYLLGRTSR